MIIESEKGMRLPLNTPQLFFDDAWIDSSRHVTRHWFPAKLYPEPIVVHDRPWESRALALYGSIWPSPSGGWRMYYSTFVPGVSYSHETDTPILPGLMLAESADGLSWEKPTLDIARWVDGQPTNISYQSGKHIDSPSVLYDPDDASAPWKMVAFTFNQLDGGWANPDWGLHGFSSQDGLHWKPVREDGLPMLRAGDRTNIMPERIDGEYRIYTRHPEMAKQTGGRAIYLSRSQDFRNWSEPELVLAPDLTDNHDVEFYGMPVFRRHGWYIGLLEYWRDEVDTIEVHLAFSRDGRTWQRAQPHVPFIAATYPWNLKWSSCVSNGPIILHEQMVFYFGGRHTSHHFDSAQLHGAIGYASLPLDRFCAIEGAWNGGAFTTPPFEWPGGYLAVNADTRAEFNSHPAHCTGEISVEVLDEAGYPFPDWSEDQSARFRGNTHCRCSASPGQVCWPSGRSLQELKGQSIRLSFHLLEARLYTFSAVTEE